MENWTKPQIFISSCLCWASESVALAMPSVKMPTQITELGFKKPLEKPTYPEIFHHSYMQIKLLTENWPRWIFCSDFLKHFKRKRQDFILRPIIVLFLYLLFIFPSHCHLANMDANQLAKTFAWEYYWMLRLCGKECLTHMCICARGEALPPPCVINLHVSEKSKI